MTKAKYLPEYLFWRRRIEGQIKHMINEHPEYFNFGNDVARGKCIRSMAKRIIGEIVAGRFTGNNPAEGERIALGSEPECGATARSCRIRRPLVECQLLAASLSAPMVAQSWDMLSVLF